jgi:salicylate hydroxylase
MSTQKSLRVAIVGGGIAGLCLTHGLLNLNHPTPHTSKTQQSHYPHLEIKVYEQVHVHRDKGGALALHRNAIGAMELIDPALNEAYMRVANSMLEDDQREMATHVILAEDLPQQHSGKRGGGGKDPAVGEVVARLGRAKGRKTVARVDLLAGYTKLLPPGTIHMGKHLDRITENPSSGEITLHFADETTATTDILIGADGIHSQIRTHLLQPTHPDLTSPVNHSLTYRVGIRLSAEQYANAISPEFQGYVPR